MLKIPEHGRLRRPEAAEYLRNKHGFPMTKATLAKLATIGGGPLMTYVGRFPLYHVDDLDNYAEAHTSAPVSSTSDRRSA